MLTSRRFDADEALRTGLVTEVAEPADLAARVDAALDALLQAPPMSAGAHPSTGTASSWKNPR